MPSHLISEIYFNYSSLTSHGMKAGHTSGISNEYVKSGFRVGCHFSLGVGKSILKRNANKKLHHKKKSL